MNSEQKLQHVMEAAGECWHVRKHPRTFEQCNKCAVILGPYEGKDNPSPDDLNELFRSADKLGFTYVVKSTQADVGLRGDNIKWHKGEGNNPAEALLNALFIATGGKE